MDTPTPTRWLDDDEQRAWRVLVESTQRLFDRLEHELKADSGLDFDRYEVLVRLSEAADGRLRMSELADQLCMSRSRLTHRIDTMEDEGLVERRQCPEDGRGMHACLTADGRLRLEAAAPGHVEGVRRYLIDVLDRDQIAAVADAMSLVAAAVRDG